MKPHLPHSLYCALLSAAALILPEAQAATEISPSVHEYTAEELYLGDDLSIEYKPKNGYDFYATRVFDGMGHTITSEEKGTPYPESGIGFPSILGYQESGSLVMKNTTFVNGSILFSYGYGTITFDNITLKGDILLSFTNETAFNWDGITDESDSLWFQVGLGARVQGDLALTPNILLDVIYWDKGFYVDGNMALSGGEIRINAWDSRDNSSYKNPDIMDLTVSGTLNIQEETKVSFSKYSSGSDNPSEDEKPVANQSFIECRDIQGDLSLLKPYLFLYTLNTPSDGYIPEYEGYIEDMGFESVATETGYLIMLVDAPSMPESGCSSGAEGCGTVADATLPVVTELPTQGALGVDYNLRVQGGHEVDVTASGTATLDGNAIFGTGTLRTGAEQTIQITMTKNICFDIVGKTDSSPGATLEFGQERGEITDLVSQIKGNDTQLLYLSGMDIKSGIVTNWNRLHSESPIQVGTSGGQAALNNRCFISGDIVVGSSGSVDNRGTISGDVTVESGGICANNDTIEGHIDVKSGGLLKGSGIAASATVSGNLQVGNAQGYQEYGSLDLQTGAHLTFTVDGERAADLLDHDEGTYSNICVTEPGQLTVSSGVTADVVFTENAVLGSLAHGDMALSLITTQQGDDAVQDVTTSVSIDYTPAGAFASFITLSDRDGTLFASLNKGAVVAEMQPIQSDFANTLWASTMVVNSFIKQAALQREVALVENGEILTGVSLWASALGQFNNLTGADGFSYDGGGYAAGVDVALNRHFRAGIAFAQGFGQFAGDSRATKIDQTSIMTGAYAGYSRTVGKWIFDLTGYAAFGVTDNDSKSAWGGITTGHADWNNDTYTAGLLVDISYRYSRQASIGITTGLDYVYGSMDSFTERYDSGLSQRITHGSMQAWRIPVGVTWKGVCELGGSQYLFPHLTVGYIGDVARHNPRVRAEALGREFRTHGCDLGRHGLWLNVGATWRVSDQWSVNARYDLEVRSGQTAQSVNVGVRYNF